MEKKVSYWLILDARVESLEDVYVSVMCSDGTVYGGDLVDSSAKMYVKSNEHYEEANPFGIVKDPTTNKYWDIDEEEEWEILTRLPEELLS